MYDETCYYDTHDPNNGGRGLALEEDLKLSSYSLEQHQTTEAANLELDHELNAHLMQDMPLPPNWESKLGQDMQYTQQQIDLQCFNPPPPPPPYGHTPTPTPDLLNLFHLPRCSISFTNPNILGEAADRSGSSVVYDSHLHLELPPQQTPIFKDLFHSLPHNYGGSSSSTCFFGGAGNGSSMGIGIGMDERDDANVGAFYHDGDGNSMLNFSRDMSMPKAEGKGNRQHFATERQRREQLNGKYTALRTLVPNPTKGDRASIVHDAIEYIKELLRTVDELKILVDKKRYGMERCKRRKTEEDAAGDMESSSLPDRDQSNGTSRGTWLKRKSKETEVDVRIIEDEVTIKLIQRKKLNCLLSVSKILDELQLDLLHVSGGNIGNSNCFLFNTKIFEGSSVHACAIANKLIEAVDKNYAAAYEPSSF